MIRTARVLDDKPTSRELFSNRGALVGRFCRRL